MSLSKRLKLIRLELKISQEKLSQLLDIPKDRIANIERGKVNNLKGEELKVLEEKFDIDPLWLSVGKGNMFKSQNITIGVHGVNNGNVHLGDMNLPKEILNIVDYLYNNVPLGKYGEVFEVIKKYCTEINND